MQKNMHVCAKCGKIFVAQNLRPKRKYCSIDCRDEEYRIRYKEKRRIRARKYYYQKIGYTPTPPQRIVCNNPKCGKLFFQSTNRQKFCSIRCGERVRYWVNPNKYRAKVKQQRSKKSEEYKARGRMTWAQMRAQRGASNAFYKKALYPWLPIFTGARHRANKTNKLFTITKEWCTQKWTGRCELTGIEFALNVAKRHPMSPSLDRIDSSKGYTPDNCQFVLWAINAFKTTGTMDEMYQMAKALLSNARSTISSVRMDLPLDRFERTVNSSTPFFHTNPNNTY